MVADSFDNNPKSNGGAEKKKERTAGQFFPIGEHGEQGDASAKVGAELHPLDYRVLDTGAAWKMTPRKELIDDVRAALINEVCSASGHELHSREWMASRWCCTTFSSFLISRPTSSPSQIRTDRGGEFLGAEMTAWLKKEGIQRELTTAYTPQSNGVAERANRTILETARALLIESGVGNSMWPHAVRHANVTRNRVLTKVGNESWVPLERWLGRKPPVDMLRVFSCMAVAHVPKKYRKTAGGQGITMQLELTPSVWEEGEEAAAEGGDGEKVQEAPAGGGGGVETSGSTSRAAGPEDEEDEPAYCFLAPAPEEPASMEEALAGPDREKWLVSRDAEYQSLLENGTWDLVVLPEGKKAVQCKWVLRIKTDDKGQVTIYKSRLVAKGFMQKEKQDFNEIFAPTAKPPTLRVLLADAAVSWKFIIQMDISMAFLNGILEEDVYMTLPPEYEDGTGRVC
ncbi:unnamed protein product [Closterium sp. NIES-53]